MLRQAQHEELSKVLTLSLSKGEKRFAKGERNGPVDHFERRTPEA
jgi:hypothetical protein